MNAPKRSFAELLSGFQQNKLSIADVVQSLNERGPVQGPMHRAELAMLDEALAGKKIDERLHRSLTAKLKDVQEKGSASVTVIKNMPAGNNDKTQMATPTVEKTTAHAAYKPVADDKTRMNPAAGGDRTALNPSAPAGGDATVINPGAEAGAGDGFDLLIGAEDEKTEMGGSAGADATGFKPSEPATASRTGGTTGGTSGPSTSTWNRVASSTGPEREVHSGDVLKDRFYLDKEVGRGGMGIVFKARDERKVEAQDKNPWVAVKVLNPEFRKHPQALVALQRESRKAQQLTHDNILRVYDFDKDGTVIYMTMEYVDGGSLKDVIKKHPNGMPFDKGWPIIAGLAHGLGRAHRDNIVHSDFKPGNVMMTTDGIPKLFDMGIARAAKSGAEAKGETTVFDAGELGALTPAYASLEMIQGQPPELIDDMYALGITAYEILTGKHPFNKKNAEQAMKEGLKPPVVPGLSRRQRKTLESSVAFKRGDRSRTCDEFVEGMRQMSAKDYALPAMIAVVAVVLLAVGASFGLGVLKNRRIDGMGQQFVTASFGEDTAGAVAALQAMDPQEAESAKQKYSKDIQDYFFKVANDKWDVAAKPPKYHYPEAVATLDSVATLFPDSARVAQNKEKLDSEKNKLLSELLDTYDARKTQRHLYEDQKDNVVETLGLIAQIEPNNEIFKSQTLPGMYTDDVQKSLSAHDYVAAERQVATAMKVYPKDEKLKKLAGEVKNLGAADLAKDKEREMQAKMSVADAKKQLADLSASPDPSFSADWQLNVSVAMGKLVGDNAPETMAMKSKLAEIYAVHIGQMTADKQLGSAQLLADSAMKMFPGTAGVMKEVAKLTEARKAYEAEQAKVAAASRVGDLKLSLTQQAKSNETDKAVKALNELKLALAANDPFLTTTAPTAIAEAYQRIAEKQAAQNRFAQARSLVAQGLRIAPTNQGLKDLDQKYAVEGNVATLQAGAQSPSGVKGEEMKAALDALRGADAARADKVGAEVQSSVLARLQVLAKADPAAAGKGKNEWLKVFPQNTQLASLVITEVATPAPSTTVPSLPQEARKATTAPRAHGVETCSASMSTFGRNGKASCQDDVAGQPGPKLVVMPNPAGGVFAMTKYEITVGQFDAFCKATGKCKAAGGNDTLPRTNVALSLVKAYAAWLSETTGFNYRLPTDAEWAHAANAGGAGAGEDFNCVLMNGSNQLKGGLPVPVSSGRPNAWGLINMVGNVAEFVESGSVRGGNFNVPMSQCTVDWRQSGGDSESNGVRLVREMG